MVAKILISIILSISFLPADYTSQSQVEKLHGDVKTITCYCEACNTPPYTKTSASGRWVEGYSVASSDYPLGTILYFDGKEYRVDDTGCPHGVVDVLIPTGENGECVCDFGEVHESEVIVIE